MRILILSDIHANLVALKTILDEEVEFDRLFFLGDVVDYGTQPKRCVDFVRTHADAAVLGNHDRAMALDVDCGCRGDFRTMSVATRAWHRTLLAEADRAYLRSLPLELFLNVEGLRFYLTHAAPGDLTRYLDSEALIDAVSGIDADVILVGHTHLQWTEHRDGRWIANPGSVGLARDAGGVACYAVWENGRLVPRRLKYPVAEAVEEVRRSPLEPAVKESLIRVLTGQTYGQGSAEGAKPL